MRTLGALLLFLLGLALFMGVVWAGCSTFLKANGPYREAVKIARADPAVVEALGAPVEEGWFLNGSIESDGMDARATYLTRLNGSRDRGTLRIRGYSDGAWRIVSMTLETGEGARLDYAPGLGFRARGAPAGGTF
jgi:hypothetical protein